MNYINEKAQLLTVEGNTQEQVYCVIPSDKWVLVLNRIRGKSFPFSQPFFYPFVPFSSYPGAKQSDFKTLLERYSQPLTFDTSLLHFNKLVYQVRHSTIEYVGYIVFDSNLCKMYFEIDETASSTRVLTVVNYCRVRDSSTKMARS
jgi:hypothetical protein